MSIRDKAGRQRDNEGNSLNQVRTPYAWQHIWGKMTKGSKCSCTAEVKSRRIRQTNDDDILSNLYILTQERDNV